MAPVTKAPKVLPLAVVAIAAIAMWGLDRLFPEPTAPLGGAWPAAGFALLGVTGFAASGWQFYRARTTVHPSRAESASALVTSGIFQYSRNPMYLAMLVWLLAWACWLSNPIVYFVLPLFVVYMTQVQIAYEEKVLRERFGSDYKAYCERVRRWL